MAVDVQFKSPLHQTVMSTSTDLWNDSCSQKELAYAIENGASGATTNPTIVTGILKKEFAIWQPVLQHLIKEYPQASEVEIAWKLNEKMGVEGAKLLEPQFNKTDGVKGRLSIQTNAQLYRNSDALLAQARHFDSLTKNVMIKLPVTAAGVEAIEECIFHGLNINATVCFTVPQAIAVAEAVERGLKRRAEQQLNSDHLHPVCTIMVGRLDDWLKVVADKENIIVTPGLLEWAGVAVMKKAYQLFQKAGYRCRLLAAAYRNHYHWSEFIGGDVVLTIPYAWQKRFNASDVEVKERMHLAVEEEIVRELSAKFKDFRRAYEPEGLALTEFEIFGPSRRTLRGFLAGYQQLIEVVRNEMLPAPE